VIVRFIESIGDKAINFILSFYEIIRFTFISIVHLINPNSYNPAMRMVLVKQIYHTSVTILPFFIMLAIFFGSAIIGVVIVLATQYNLQYEIGSIIVTFVIDEFAPFFTALLISLRSATTINTEMAVMNLNKELDTLKEYKIDIINYLVLPRLISGVISSVSLSILFALIMLTSGYIFTLFYMNMDLHTYKYLILNAIMVQDVVTLLLKSIAFGFVIMIIPIYSGLKSVNKNADIPKSILSGMVKLFITIFFIEVLSLIIQSL